jgi:glycerol-3-phosphate dehydrogenase (NAD(P)+)
MKSKNKQIAVIGAGAWGTAIANVISNNVEQVKIWALEKQVADEINLHHKNNLYLPDVALSKKIIASNSLKDIVNNIDYIFLVTPSKFIENQVIELKSLISSKTPIVICSKGIDEKTGELPHQIVSRHLKNPLLVLSGPSFAKEVANGIYTEVCLAGSSTKIATEIKGYVETKSFKVKVIKDVIGAEVAGAMKNVIAIACGILDGKGEGQNARAVMITKGLQEMVAITKKMGGAEKTIYNLCGVGDLVLTATSTTSRNFSFGVELGRGGKKSIIEKQKKSVAEGVFSCYGLMVLCKKINYNSKICEFVYEYLQKN